MVTFIRPIFFYHKLVNSSPALGFGGVVTPPGVEGCYNHAVNLKKNIFSDLWKKLKIPPSKFLSHARLVAVYYLKMSGIVEEILELKLGLIKDNVMSVQFRGQRKSPYINQEPAVIQFKGTCPLNG